MQELMTHVESFQCEAQKVIQSGTTDVAQLQQLLDNGHTLDVDLPEIPKLKQVWAELYQVVFNRSVKPSSHQQQNDVTNYSITRYNRAS